MADSSTLPVMSFNTTVNSKLSDFAVKDGQLIFIKDKQAIALDFDGKRTVYNQIEVLPTEDSRASLLAPVTGRFYYVVDPPILWRYEENGWVQITTRPEDLSAVEKAAKDYADEISKRVTGSVDENGNFVIMFGELFDWTTET